MTFISDPATVNPMDRELPLRVTVVRPPSGVAVQIQRGRDGLLPATSVAGDTMTFELTVRVRQAQPGGPLRLLGDYAQGPPTGRFLYVNSGKRAGQADSCWDRRAKVSLMAITPAQIASVLKAPGAVIEARIAGTAPDGGPACATVPLLDGGWRVVG